MNMRILISKIAGVAFVATLLLTASCSSDSDEPASPFKNPQLEPGTDAKPSWTVSSGLFDESEQTMSVVLTLQPELAPYASAGDLMCAVVNGEVRGVCSGRQLTDGTVYFPLIIAGNTGGEQIALSYYCQKLQRIYSNSSWNRFNSSLPPTNEGDYYVVTFF